MLLERPEDLNVCWAESTFLVNFEADTLPLLFASEGDYALYWNTMLEMHHRKARHLEHVRKANTRARDLKESGDYIGCIKALGEACDLRHKIFAAGDYQIVAAVEHLIWSQLHLATLLLAEEGVNDTCHRLFMAAAEKIRAVRGKTTVADGLQVTLRKDVIHLLRLVLHHNWANYWARRYKWNATVQHTTHAKNLWLEVCSNLKDRQPEESQKVALAKVTDFLSARAQSALCGTWEEPNLNMVFQTTLKVFKSELTSLSHPHPSGGEVEKTDEKHQRLSICSNENLSIRSGSTQQPVDGSPGSHGEGNEPSSFKLVKITLAPKATSEAQPGPDDLPPIPITLILCLETSWAQAATTWPLRQTGNFLSLYAHGFAAFALRKYPVCTQTLQVCSELANGDGATCNPAWWKNVVDLYGLVSEAPGADKAAPFRMNKADMMQKDVLNFAKAMRTEVSLHPSRVVKHIRAQTPNVLHATVHHPKRLGVSPESRAKTPQEVEGTEWSLLHNWFGEKGRPLSREEIFQLSLERIPTPMVAAQKTVGDLSPPRPKTSVEFKIPGRQELPRLGGPPGGVERSPAKSSQAAADVQKVRKGSERESTTISDTPTKVPAPIPIREEDEALLDEALSEYQHRDAIERERALQQQLQEQMERMQEALRASKLREEKLSVLPSIAEHSIAKQIEEEEAKAAREKEAQRLAVELRKKAKSLLQKQKETTKAKKPKESRPHTHLIRFVDNAGGDGDPHEASGSLVKDSLEESRTSTADLGHSVSSAVIPLKRRKSGYKLDVDVDTTAADIDGEQKFDRNYSIRHRQSQMIADHTSGIVHATKQYDFLPEVEGIIEKQKILRSMLPAMDHRCETYRMIMKELAENEQILKMRRKEVERKKLEDNAERVAKKAGMVNIWRKLVQKRNTEEDDLRRQSLSMSLRKSSIISPANKPQAVEEKPETWTQEELDALAVTAATLLAPVTLPATVQQPVGPEQ